MNRLWKENRKIQLKPMCERIQSKSKPDNSDVNTFTRAKFVKEVKEKCIDWEGIPSLTY